jgi:hypothetical protein
MFQFKGFARIKSLIDNNVGVLSPIGEPSTWVLTFSKEKGEYFKDSTPGISLVSLSSVDTGAGKKQTPLEFSDHMLDVVSWIATHAFTKLDQINVADFKADTFAHFYDYMTDFNHGPLVSNGVVSLPEWISWKNPLLSDNLLKIWFADAAMRDQYDETEIVVVPAMQNLDDFFLMPNVVKVKLAAQTMSTTIDLLQAAKGNNPETVIRTDTYDYKHPLYPDVVLQTNWSTLIYGISGDNVDSVKESIITYVLTHSTHPRSEWEMIIPDLFKRTEFVILPRWDKYAIPNLTVQAGIYSPIQNLKESLIFAKSKITDYPSDHINDNLDAFSHVYRSLSLLIIGNKSNRNNAFALTDIFPDYISVGTTSVDFNRMSLNTSTWSVLLERMLIAAESMTAHSTLPTDMRRVTRSNILYITTVYKNIQYLVAAKTNYGG